MEKVFNKVTVPVVVFCIVAAIIFAVGATYFHWGSNNILKSVVDKISNQTANQQFSISGKVISVKSGQITVNANGRTKTILVDPKTLFFRNIDKTVAGKTTKSVTPTIFGNVGPDQNIIAYFAENPVLNSKAIASKVEIVLR